MKSAKYVQRTTTVEQFGVLTEEMKKLAKMARDAPMIYGSKRKKWVEEWEIIRQKLNSRGPPIRSTAEWKKVWADLKTRTKKKLADNAMELSRRGEGPPCISFLNSAEQAVEKLLNLPESEFSQANFYDFGHRPRKRSSADLRNEEATTAAAAITLPETNLPAAPSQKRHKPEDEEFLILLRQQTATQQELCKKLDKLDNLENITNSIGKISNSMEKTSTAIGRIARALELLVSTQNDRQAAQTLLDPLEYVLVSND